MFDLVVTARFKQVVETYEVALYVGVRVGDGVAHACLCGKVDHNGYVVAAEERVYGILVGDGSLHKGPVAPESLYLFEAFVLDVHVIVGGDVVDAYHPDIAIVGKEPLNEIAADEAGCPCYEHRLSGQVYIRWKHIVVSLCGRCRVYRPFLSRR